MTDLSTRHAIPLVLCDLRNSETKPPMRASSNLTKSELHLLARLFSPSAIRELGTRGQSGLIGRILSRDSLPMLGNQETRLDQVFDSAFRLLMKTGCRPAYVFTNALVEKRLLGLHNLNTATAIREFRTGKSRVDLAIFNGTSTAYEIKSDWDSLYRLEGQVADYLKVFDEVYVFTSEANADSVIAGLPPEVGVLCLSDRFTISTRKPAIPNQTNFDVGTIFDALRNDEIGMILRRHNFHLPEVPNTKLRSELRKLFLDLTGEEAHRGMVDVIRVTRDQRHYSDLVDQLPQSLRAAVITASLSRLERSRLMESMSTPVDTALAWR